MKEYNLIESNKISVSLKKVIIVFVFFTTTWCNCLTAQTPAVEFKPYQFKPDIQITKDSFYIVVTNPVRCPMRYYLESNNQDLQENLVDLFPIYLNSLETKTLLIGFDKQLNVKGKIINSSYFRIGNLNAIVNLGKYALPFKECATYTVLQGYDGVYSHNKDNYNRYGIDFNLKTGDTVCATQNGIIVELIYGYNIGSGDPEHGKYTNYITIFHDELNTYSQYLHLKQNGSLVSIGDDIQKGQPIALSGNTGHTTGPHLHFSVLVPDSSYKGLKSIPIQFENGYWGKELKEGDVVSKEKFIPNFK